jgi:Ser/Thr protein kinase RdoA (MazF antagonist)
MEIERSIQNIVLNSQQLLELIQPAFPECVKLTNFKILSGGALNTNYKLGVEGKQFVLRIYVRDRAHCKMEKEIHALIDSKVSTPHLIYADENHHPFAYSIFQFIDGNHISEVPIEIKKPLSYELGSVLASIHGFKFEKAGLFGDGIIIAKSFETGSSPYFEEAFRVLSNGQFVRDRLGDKLSNEMLDFMLKNKDFFPRVDDNICLTHSDFKPVNLLYKTGNVVVLDWEFAHAGIGILDFAILLRHRDQFPFDSKSLVKGYSDFGGKLPEEWFRSALITDFVNIVQLLDSAPERPQLFHQLRNSVQKTICEWNNSY